MKRLGFWLVGAMILVLGWGCGGDMSKTLTTNLAMRDQVISTFSRNQELASLMMDRLLDNDTTRTLVVDKLMTNGPAMQLMMAKMAGDETMIDGLLNVAVQDSSIKQHVITLFRGMEMGAR